MASAKKIVTGIVTAAVVCGLGAGGWMLYQRYGGPVSDRTEKVYVQKVSTLNTVGGANLFATNFAGVIVAQKTIDVKYDTSKTIDEVLVQNGDTVKKGDKLMTYNVEAIQIEIETAKLEVERMKNQIETNKSQITELEQQRKTADGDAQVSYTTQILTLQGDNARTEYDIKTKEVEITKMENSLDNAFVTAPIDGTVKDLKESFSPDAYSENADVLLKLSAEGDYRVKGTFNEQNSNEIYKGARVYLKSRINDTVIPGEVSEIDTSPQTSSGYDMYSMGMSDEMSTSSKYAFYVKPDQLEGFMLGQHILIELENGQEDSAQKEGIWIYSSFVLWDGDKNYVWVKNGQDRIEKRTVEVGEVDDDYGDCQILSGITIDDYIAYPADYIEAGMVTTTNQSDKDVPQDEMGGDMYNDMEPDMGGEDVVYDENGNMDYVDEEGNNITVDDQGNIIEGEDGMKPDDAKASEKEAAEDAAPAEDAKAEDSAS